MKILLLTCEAVYPPDDGIKLRAWNLFSLLAKRHTVDNIVLKGDLSDSHRALRNRFHSVRIIGLGPDKGLGYMTSMYTHEANMAFRKMVGDAKPDIILGASAWTAPYLSSINDIPVIIDLIDAPVLGAWRNFLVEKNIRRKLKQLLVSFHMKRHARMYLEGATVIVASEVDAISITQTCRTCRAICLPNGVDVNFFSPVENDTDNQLSVVFTGNMGYQPNVLAVEFFYKKIFPLITKEVPDLKFYIVGRNPVESIADLARKDKRVVVTGPVPDMRPFLSKSTVVVCPMISGSGIKNKILEAWAMARPVVATSMSLGGLNARPHENIIAADGVRSFSSAVIKLLRDKSARHELGKRARSHVMEYYSWDLQARKLEQIMKEIAQ